MQKNDKRFDVSFFHDLFRLVVFSGVFQPWELKSTTKNNCKKIVQKNVYKKVDKNPNTDLFLGGKNHVFGRFLFKITMRGV
jgi:hypothetical protein